MQKEEDNEAAENCLGVKTAAGRTFAPHNIYLLLEHTNEQSEASTGTTHGKTKKKHAESCNHAQPSGFVLVVP